MKRNDLDVVWTYEVMSATTQQRQISTATMGDKL